MSTNSEEIRELKDRIIQLVEENETQRGIITQQARQNTALSRQLELGEIDMDAARQENVDALKDLGTARRDLKQLRRAIANVLV